MKHFFPLLLTLAAALLFYSNTYNNEFVFDDHDIIVNNKAIRDITDLKTVLTTNYWHDQANAGLYRPFIFMLYAVDYAFWGINPIGYHITNMLFHLLACVFLFAVAGYFVKDSLIQWLSVLLFAVHPVHIEAVTGVVGRAEVVGACFFCLSWLLFLRGYSDKKNGKTNISYVVSWLAYFFALASKENTFVLPVVLLISMIFFEKKLNWKNSVIRIAPYAVFFFLYMYVRFKVIGSVGPQDNEQFFHDTPLFSVFLTMIRVFAFYFKLLLVPTDLLASYRMWQVSTSLLDWRVLAALPVVVCWIYCASLFFFRKKVWQFCLLFMLVTLFPVSNIIPIGDIMAERFLYLPSVGFCILFAIVLINLLNISGQYVSRKAGIIYLLILTLFFGVAMLIRNAQWRDGIIFWKTTIKDIPKSYSAYTNLAFSYADRKMYSHALWAVDRALNLNPRPYVAKKLRARLLYETGRHEDVVKQSLDMIETDPAQYDGYDYMALSLMQLKKMDQAVSVCEKGISVVNDRQPLYYTLIRLYFNMNDSQRALQTAKRAIQNNPSDAKAYVKAGECHAALDSPGQAIQYYHKALTVDRYNLEALDKLASLYFSKNEYEKALFYWLRAIKKYPDRKYLWYYIGIAFEKQGNMQMALDSWKKVEHLPEFKERVAKKLQPR